MAAEHTAAGQAKALAVAPDVVVTVVYRLLDEQGTVCDEVVASQPLEYIHGYAQVIAGLAAGLEGCGVGEERRIALEPESAFGERSPDMMLEVDRHDFPVGRNLVPGDEVLAEGPDGTEWSYRVAELSENTVLLDLNHPLAGQRVCFETKVLAMRPASEEEVARALAEANERIVYESTIVYGSGAEPSSEGSELVQLRLSRAACENPPDKESKEP